MQMNYSVPVSFNPGEKRRLVFFITRASCAHQLVAQKLITTKVWRIRSPNGGDGESAILKVVRGFIESSLSGSPGAAKLPLQDCF